MILCCFYLFKYPENPGNNLENVSFHMYCNYFDILNLQSKLFHDTSGTQLWRWSSIVFSSDVIHEQNIRYGGDICFCDVATRVAKSLTGAWKFGLLMQFKQM